MLGLAYATVCAMLKNGTLGAVPYGRGKVRPRYMVPLSEIERVLNPDRVCVSCPECGSRLSVKCR